MKAALGPVPCVVQHLGAQLLMQGICGGMFQQTHAVGPGMTVGAGLALKGTGRIAVGLLGDGDFLMCNTAVWTAAHYQIPCLMIVCNEPPPIFLDTDLGLNRV